MHAQTAQSAPSHEEDSVSSRYPLGSPLPPSLHAVSVSLPRWADVVAYEEKNPETISRLQVGYPRFLVHPRVLELARTVAPSAQVALPFPSAPTARRCVDFMKGRAGAEATILPGMGCFVVATGEAGRNALKEFWQHTGLVVSSRQADTFLRGESGRPDPGPAIALRARLAELYDCRPDDVFLAPSGMAAQFAALRAVHTRRSGRRTVQLGFPYVDTLKLQEKFGAGSLLLHDLARMDQDLRHALARETFAACFAEIPGNPLLGSADLGRITPVLQEHRVPLVADDVVATPANIDLRRHADLIATSLTKFISGSGDVMAGAIVCNPHSPLHGELRPILEAQHEELLWHEDAARVEELARGFPERMRRHNDSGLVIAERLRAHPAVERVWYPKWEFDEAYETVRRPDGGWGGLITFLPHDAPQTAPDIYDRLPVCKGPSLGTVFTLACPFTLLAHYTELDWAEACGVPRYLIRISVGLEDVEELWAKLESSLNGQLAPPPA